MWSLLVNQDVGQETYEGTFNPCFPVDEYNDEERQEEEGYDEEGEGSACNWYEPIDYCKREVEQERNA